MTAPIVRKEHSTLIRLTAEYLGGKGVIYTYEEELQHTGYMFGVVKSGRQNKPSQD
jgi:hypothetical protein